jgi:thioredoxin 1
MATVALTGENFNEYVEKDGVLVIYDKASENHTDITFGKVNTEDQPELAGTFQIQAIPTLMVFRDQVLVFARPGAIPAPALEDLLTQVKALDMDDIRKQIAEQEAGAQEADGDGDGDGDRA